MERIAGSPVEIATRLRLAVRERVGIPVTVGIARTKFLAKVASALRKPDGLLVVPADRESAFLHPLPVERVWGVGKVTAEKLHGWGITTVGDIAQSDVVALELLLGRHAARHLHALANHRDPRVVRLGRRRGSIGSQHAIGRRPHTPEQLDAELIGIVDRVTRRARAARRVGRR
jgi:Nucleotidyltransferase/DNA polymerase involved in DNA repair